jgi:trehalose 6-phosphate phosphatase
VTAALHAHADLASFYARLQEAPRRVLMLDYDGTLAPFRVRPEQATPYPGVSELLETLAMQEDTRIVVVTGRRARDVAELLEISSLIEIWGVHGWERLLPGQPLSSQEPSAEIRLALAQAHTLADDLRRSGARIERKPASIAFHWRGLPDSAADRLREQLQAAWRPFADGAKLEWLPFDGGVELRAPGANKRYAVSSVLSEITDDSVAAYLGDDLTDEDAFRAIKGRGLAVLVRPECRETAADVWIRPPDELLEFIGRWRRNGAGR